MREESSPKEGVVQESTPQRGQEGENWVLSRNVGDGLVGLVSCSLGRGVREGQNSEMGCSLQALRGWMSRRGGVTEGGSLANTDVNTEGKQPMERHGQPSVPVCPALLWL